MEGIGCMIPLFTGMQNLHKGVLRDEALYSLKLEEHRQRQQQSAARAE